MTDRPGRHLIHAGAALLVLLAILLASPPARRFYRANEARHLLNANDFVGALDAYQRLAARDPKAATRLPDFPHRVARRAREFYLSPERIGAEQSESFAKLVGLLERDAQVAGEGRRLLLAVHARGNRPTEAATRTALSILEHEGYDAEALWWATVGEYDPLKPLQTPQILDRFRADVEDSLSRETADPEESVTRNLYLGALIAIADENWARAARLFDHYRRRAPEAAPHELAFSVALIRSGQPEAAVPVLRDYRERKTDLPLINELLTEAYLRARDFPWAAEQGRIARQRDPQAVIRLTARVYPGAGDDTEDPMIRLGCNPEEAGSLQNDAAFWTWLDSMAEDDAQRAAVRDAAHRLAERGFANCFDAAWVLQYGLREKDHDLLVRLPAGIPPFEEADRQRADAMGRIIAWYPRRDDAATTAPPFSDHPALLHTRGATQEIRLKLPAGISVLVVMVRGYPAEGLWPLLHLNLDEQGARLYDAHTSKATAPLVLVLDRPLTEDRDLPLAVSLVNGGETGLNTPGALVADVYGF